jgi:type I restriction enzyme M protein
MTEQKSQLAQQLWIIANTLRGKMDANYFRDYIAPFIFYKYLSTKTELYANAILATDHLNFDQVAGYGQEATLIQQI